MAHNTVQETTSSLYQEFLSYIKGKEKKQLQTFIEQEYKNLYSWIHKSNNKKRMQRQQTQVKEFNIKNSGCKFTKIQGGFREFEGFKSTIVQNQSVLWDVDHNGIDDQILMQQNQKKQLQYQISSYKIQLRQTQKQISQQKQQLKELQLQQDKYTSINHLATNIIQFTDQYDLINTKNYNKMVQEQQQILQKLKKLRSKAKQQLAQTQHLYHVHQKEHQMKFKKLVKSAMPLQEDNNDKKIGKGNVKVLRKFMEGVERVLELLENREANFQTIKQEQCTKLTNKKLNSELLPADRVEWTKLIQQFQVKFGMRVESSDKILVKLFKQIKQSNQQIQKRIFQHRCQIEDYTAQLSQLSNKLSTLPPPPQQQVQISSPSHLGAPISLCQIIHLNSITFIQIMEVANNLLTKFRYIFKLFIMMNIDKRRLSDQILKLQQVLDKKGAVIGGIRWSQVDGKNMGLIQDTNVVELADIMGVWFQQVQPSILIEILSLFFNDLRIALLCRKTMIMQQLQQLRQSGSLSDFIGILTSIRQQCEYTYNQKLKSSLKLLYDCFKCSIKSSSSANTSRSASTTTLTLQKSNSNSHQIQTPPAANMKNILDSELYLPSGMFPKTKIGGGGASGPADDGCQSAGEDSGELQGENQGAASAKWIKLKLVNNCNQVQKLDTWGKAEKRNPAVIIRKLLAIRNQSTKKFKLLDLHECQKKYIKNSLKSMAQIQFQNIPQMPKSPPPPQKPAAIQAQSLKSILFQSERKQKQKHNNCQKQQNIQINNFVK